MPDDLIQRLHNIAHWLSRAASTQEDATTVVEAIDLIERLQATRRELRDAYAHHNYVIATKRSEFIAATGRKGRSPWAELHDAIRAMVIAGMDAPLDIERSESP